MDFLYSLHIYLFYVASKLKSLATDTILKQFTNTEKILTVKTLTIHIGREL